jgi:hypothetical protein
MKLHCSTGWKVDEVANNPKVKKVVKTIYRSISAWTAQLVACWSLDSTSELFKISRKIVSSWKSILLITWVKNKWNKLHNKVAKFVCSNWVNKYKDWLTTDHLRSKVTLKWSLNLPFQFRDIHIILHNSSTTLLQINIK